MASPAGTGSAPDPGRRSVLGPSTSVPATLSERVAAKRLARRTARQEGGARSAPPPPRGGRASVTAPAPVRPLSRLARRRRRGRRVARTFLVFVLAVVVGLTTFVSGLLAAPFDLRAVPPAPKPVLLLASDGTQFGQIRPVQRREVLKATDIPDVMRQAIISAEDARFLDHQGVDPLATIRAAYRDLSGGRRQGGSTITQQYVKNTYVGDDRTVLRKVKEAAIAVRLEKRKSKQDILTDYLNVLYLGNSTYGVQAASKYYFGVPVQDLELSEATGKRDPILAIARASMLAGIAPAPSAYNPVRSFSQARLRQRYTLNQMVINKHISAAEASAAFTRQGAVFPLRETPPEPPSTAPEFADLVTAQLKERYKDDQDALDRGGFRVKTTLDTDLQEAVTRAAREVLPDPDDPQAAVVAIDITNGDVKAMTTLRRRPQVGEQPPVDGYERGGFNLATNALRSTGSTIKPFTLAVALEKGLSLNTRRSAPACDTIRDRFADGGFYRYCNAAGEGGASRGSLTLRRALQGSVNTVYVPLAIEVGRSDIKKTMLASGVVVAKPTETNPNPFSAAPTSFGLGTTAEVTPLSMANAFGTLMNHGVHMSPRYVLETRDRDGAVVSRAPAKPKAAGRAMPKEIADQVVEAMSGVTKPGGTAPSAAQSFLVYGKTGTTNDSTDAWFIGCARSPQNICLATWMGFDRQTCDNVVGRACGGMLGIHGVKQVYGGTLPAKIFSRSFEILREIQAQKRIEQAGGVPSPVATVGPASEPVPSPTRRRRRSPRPEPVRSAAPAPVRTPAGEPAPPPPPSPDPPPPEPSPPTVFPSPAAAEPSGAPAA